MQLSDAPTALERLGLGEIADWVLARHMPCTWLVLGEPGEGPPGGSRIGGRPDGPDGMEWPRLPDGEPMDFVLQLALHDPTLPLSGLLSLFVAFDPRLDGLLDTPHRAVLTPWGQELRPIVPPAPSGGASTFGGLQPHRLRLAPGADFPHWGDPGLEALLMELTDEAGEAYDQFERALRLEPADRVLGKLLGHVQGIGDDPREFAVPGEHGDGARVEDWVNLLAVEPCGALGLSIMDAGHLVVMVKQDDLARGDLAATYAQVESH